MLKRVIDQHSTRMMSFVLIGAIGFIVDATILTLLYNFLDYNLYLSRLISFTAAVLVTWILNRLHTFHSQIPRRHSKSGEFSRYLTVQTGGALLNLLIFVLVIWLIPSLKNIAIIPLAIGSAFGLLFNYSGAHYWVYRHTNNT